MDQLINNANPKRNPFTSFPGMILIILGLSMYALEFLYAPFTEHPEKFVYAWYQPLVPFGIGLLFIFMNDDYFSQLFGLGKDIVKKKAGVNENKDA